MKSFIVVISFILISSVVTAEGATFSWRIGDLRSEFRIEEYSKIGDHVEGKLVHSSSENNVKWNQVISFSGTESGDLLTLDFSGSSTFSNNIGGSSNTAFKGSARLSNDGGWTGPVDVTYTTVEGNDYILKTNSLDVKRQFSGTLTLELPTAPSSFNIEQWNWDTLEFDDKNDGILRCSKIRTACFTLAPTAADKKRCDKRQDDCVARVERMSSGDMNPNQLEVELAAEESQDSYDGYLTVTGIKGDVEVSYNGGKTWEALRTQTPIWEGMMLSTGPESEVILNFGEAGDAIVGSVTTIEIDEGYFSNSGRARLELSAGTVRSRVRLTAAIRSGFSVTTPTATASVRGTDFEMSYDSKINQSKIKTFEGAVTVEDNNGNRVDVDAGSQIRVGDSLETIEIFDTTLQKSNSIMVWLVLVVAILGGIGFYFRKNND